MILVDSNILIDLLEPDSPHYDWSGEKLDHAMTEGAFINHLIMAEIGTRFSRPEELEEALQMFGLPVEPLDTHTAWRAGRAYLLWIRNGGRRGVMLPDLIIGAHAIVRKAAILTRDPRRFKTYFPELDLITPDTADTEK